jgi:hypothetical protein
MDAAALMGSLAYGRIAISELLFQKSENAKKRRGKSNDFPRPKFVKKVNARIELGAALQIDEVEWRKWSLAQASM